MKTVITSSGNTKSAEFDLRFGRAAFFCLLDEESGNFEFHENPYQEEESGAGTKVSEKMLEWGVQKVISGDFGPKAKQILERFKVQMVILPAENQLVEQIITTLQGNTNN